MANQTMTGTTRYPLPTRQQVDVSVPTMDAGKWVAPTYAETPEYAPLGWQMAGVRGSRFGPPPTQSTSTRGPSDLERAMQRAAMEKIQGQNPNYMYNRTLYGMEVLPTLSNFEQSGRVMGLSNVGAQAVAEEGLRGVMTPMEQEQLRQTQLAREKATAWGNDSPGGGADVGGGREKAEERYYQAGQKEKERAHQLELERLRQQSSGVAQSRG